MSENGIKRRRFVMLGGMFGAAVAVGGGGYTAANWVPDDREELLRETMGDGMSKVLVVYGTKPGRTAGVAQQISATLAEAGVTAEVVPAQDKPDPAAYDAVVVGSGIRVGSGTEPPRSGCSPTRQN